MSIQRVFLTLLAVLLLPSLAWAQAEATRTTFTVNKTFTDGNNAAEVTVHIQCFTGLPLNQSQTREADNNGEFEVEFVVEQFDQGDLDCDIWEEEVPGYSASYSAYSEFGSYDDDSDGCHFDNIDNSNLNGEDPQNSCDITNTPDPVEVVVHKDWVIDGVGGDLLDPSYKLVLYCEDEIVDGYEHYGNWRKTLYNSGYNGTNDEEYSASVIPDWDGGTECWVDETVYDSSVEVSSYCNNLFVELGEGDSCTITNTVFYEGIPTLSQYGMAIMALLMLGVGFVGFRRFV
jgi:hypothetical protein